MAAPTKTPSGAWKATIRRRSLADRRQTVPHDDARRAHPARTFGKDLCS
jgi:hypothetical protein